MKTIKQLHEHAKEMALFEREMQATCPGWEEECSKWEVFTSWFYKFYLWNLLRAVLVEMTCRIYGHDCEDNSSIGPECGIEDVSCRRCGDGFRHIYY